MLCLDIAKEMAYTVRHSMYCDLLLCKGHLPDYIRYVVFTKISSGFVIELDT